MKSTENKNLITVLYCRLSQEDEKLGKSLFIENQRRMLQKYPEEHQFPNIQVYVDGADFNCPSFKRMMNDVECGKVGIVIVKDQSRLGRDYLQTGMLMEITFPQYDVRFIAINDGVDSANGVSDFFDIKNYFNDYYTRDTSRKIRAVQRAKGERGEKVGTTIPYGYMKNPDNLKQYIPDSKTAPIVKRIFEMYTDGIGIVKITEDFYAMATRNGEAEAKKFYHTAKREKEQIEKRIKELDNIIRCLYEDRVCGRLTPERYDTMSGGYEQELKTITKHIDQMDMREMCIREFVDKAKSYMEMSKLTSELLRIFIHRIDVYKKMEKYSRTEGNQIDIFYTFRLTPQSNGMPALDKVIRPIKVSTKTA